MNAASPPPTNATPSSASAATPSGTATPAPYRPIPCGTLITQAHLVGKAINPDNLGRLLAQALRMHGYHAGTIDLQIIGKSVIDFAECFRR